MQTVKKPSSVKFWNSLVTRAGLFFISLVLISIVISGYVVYSKSAVVITDHSKERLKYTNDLISQSFYAMLDQVSNDIGLLAENPVLNDFISNSNEENKSRLLRLFKSTLANKPSYFQLRYISAIDPGKELIRFDKLNDVISQMPEDRLQFKNDRDYYLETIRLPSGGFFYSKINLNEEHGKVDLPHTPTLRAASPIYNHEGQLVGILVINVDLGGQYEHFSQISEPGMSSYLIDAMGEYIFAPDLRDCFASQLEHDAGFTKDFNQPLNALSKSQHLENHHGNKFIYIIDTLTYYESNQQLYLLSMLERGAMLQSALSVRDDAIKAVLLVCLFALITILLFTGIFSRRITAMTRAVLAYQEDQTLHLPDNQKDELGLLARTFNRMSKRIQQQMKALNVSLSQEQKAIREKDEFLQNMSHEIRTPLNAIMGLTNVLNKNKPNENQLPIIRSLQRSAQNLNGLMHDILDHQKMKEGKITIHLSPTNVHQLLLDIHSAYRYEALSKGLEFDLQLDPTIQSYDYLSDRLRLGQIVTNLVVNAIKFTESGRLILAAKYESTTADQGSLIIKIEDTGVGIPIEQLDRINQRFYQIDTASNPNTQGYGLGLSIVRHLIELFNGQLKVKSTPNEGSVFTISVPSTPIKSNKKEVTKKQSRNKYPLTKKTKKVIHLEDDESSRHLVHHLLESLPIHLLQLETIEECQQQLSNEHVDLLISDLLLKKQQIAEDLTQIKLKSQIPLLLLSGIDKENVRSISEHHIQKPFDSDHFVDMVNILLYQDEFDIPRMTSYYNQYDFKLDKIRTFLSIIIKEFNTYLDRIERVYDVKDEDEWLAIQHKLTTHMQSLNLKRLSKRMPERIQSMDETTYQFIINTLLYCLSYFRVELIKSTE